MLSLLSDALFWVAVAVCAVAQAAIVRSALGVQQTAAAPGTTLPPLRRAVEVAWTIVPALALATLLVFTWRAMHPPVVHSSPRPTPLLTLGEQQHPAARIAAASDGPAV
ncbi:MAG TPA: hypothetical protein VFJ74_09915 [Gemmatimonadaceae bacterium]|nr:hypothetical protein [Gemmatimonadaceae bacterium]